MEKLTSSKSVKMNKKMAIKNVFILTNINYFIFFYIALNIQQLGDKLQETTTSSNVSLQSQLENQNVLISSLKAEKDKNNKTIVHQSQQDTASSTVWQAERDRINAIIDNLQKHQENQNSNNANLEVDRNQKNALISIIQSQQDKLTAKNANLRFQLANLQAEQDKKNVIIAKQTISSSANKNLLAQLANQTSGNAHLLSQLLNQKVIIANLTAERDQVNVAMESTAIYPEFPLLFDVRRSPTTPVPANWGFLDMARVTYDKSIVNIGNYMDIKTGIFTAPKSGFYLFSWTGPNGEFIPRKFESRFQVNYDYYGTGLNDDWEEEIFKTRIFTYLNNGDRVAFWALFRADLYAKQYEKFVAYFINASAFFPF